MNNNDINRKQWRKMKKLAFDHPYFDVSKNRISEADAERLLEAIAIPSGREVIESIRKELEYSGSTASVSWLINGTTRKVPRFLYKGIIAAVLLVLLSGFFTFTKPGVALAEALYQIVVDIVHETLRSHSRLSKEEIVSPINFRELPDSFESIEAVAKETGRALLAPDSNYTQVSMNTQVLGEESLIIRTKYMSNNGEYVSIIHTLHNSGTTWGSTTSADGNQVERLMLPPGDIAYIGLMEDGTAFAEIYEDGYDFCLNSLDLDLSEIKGLILSLQSVT